MLYFDLTCGASGDMILASLVDLGVPLPYLEKRFQQLKIPGLRIGRSPQHRAGRDCTQLSIDWSQESQQEYRNLDSIMTLVKRGGYETTVVEIFSRILVRLAEAESRVHRVALDQVHFHEIGAVDTVVDVLGFALAADYLKADDIAFSALTVGSGTISTSHGLLEVPAPATREMLAGFRVQTLDTGTEILTPTGCAILTGCGRQLEEPPEGRLLGRGFGCGQKNIAGFPDYLQVRRLDTG